MRMVTMATATNYKIFLVSIVTLIWHPWMHLGANGQAKITVSTPQTLSVREGENVLLVCTYDPRTENPQFFGNLAWQMGDTLLASYSCPNTCSKTNSNTERFSLDVDSTFSGNLTITSATLEDDNQYECRVTTLDGFGQSISQLIVNVPPVSLKLSDAMTPDGHEQGDIVPVILDQSYTVTCATEPGANPHATLEWVHTAEGVTEGAQQDDQMTGSKLTVSSRELIITPSMADHLSSITCVATHPALDTSLTKFIQLDVQVPPNDVRISFDSITVPDGGKLTLQQGTASMIKCRSLGTRPASTITWYLDGVQVRSGVGAPTYSPNANVSRLQDASSSIIIQPARENHGQVLRCVAETFGNSLATSIDLSVDGPPDPPVITGIPDNLSENQQTTITCQADNGHPSSSFQWFIGNRNLTADATLQDLVDVNERIDATSQLRYLPLREDNGEALQCNVLHDALSQPLKVMSDQLTVNYCPTTAEVISCPEVVAGSSELMVCQSGASNPASNLVWMKGIEAISQPSALETRFEESADPLGQRTTLSYSRNFTKDDYEQSFICCTTIAPLCDSTVCSAPCIPNVKYAPETPIISRNIPDLYIAEGTPDLEITCRAEGNPRPALTWVLSGNEGLMLDQLTLEDGLQLLRFRDVRRENKGVYRCIANNNIPPRSSRDYQLIVYFPPTIQNKADNRIIANEGTNASLSCVVKGNPSPEVTWKRLGNQSSDFMDRMFVVNTEVNSDYESIVTSTLTILEIHPGLDHGDYKCTATSNVGKDEAIINLSGTSKPEPPTSLMIDASQTKADSLMVAWQPGFDGGAEQSYVLTYCLNNTQLDCKSIFGIKESEYVLEELEGFSWYTITVFAENSNGKSEGSSEIQTSTAPLPPSEYGISVTNENGLITLKSNADTDYPDEITFKIETDADGYCNTRSKSYRADGTSVQKPSDQAVSVSSFGRGMCSVRENVNMAPLNTQSSGPTSTVIGAIIGAVLFMAIILIAIVFVRRNYERKHKANNLEQGSLRSGSNGQQSNGQARPFLSDNPVYDDVAKEDFRKSQHEGRIVTEDGLIYAEVAHTTKHPDGKPPIRTEEPTIYATLDFEKMQKDDNKNIDSNKLVAECPEKESLIYENITPQGIPVSP